MNTQKYDIVEVELIQSSGLFDIEWYKRAYPEVSQSGLNPIEHYLRIGAQQKKWLALLWRGSMSAAK